VTPKAAEPAAEDVQAALAMVEAQKRYHAEEEAFRTELQALLTKYKRRPVIQQVINFVPEQG
jgi:hypothetical protein